MSKGQKTAPHLLKNPDERDFYVAAIFGEKAQGKSTFLAEEIAKPYMQETARAGLMRRVLIHDPSLARAFKQFERISLDELIDGVLHPTTFQRLRWKRGIRCIGDENDDEETIKSIVTYFNNGLFISDESNGWMRRSGDCPKWQKDLFTKNRNLGLDCYFTFHRFEDLHIALRNHVWEMTVFRTPDFPSGVDWFEKRQFPNPKGLYDAWRIVESKIHNPKDIIQHFEVIEKSFKPRI